MQNLLKNKMLCVVIAVICTYTLWIGMVQLSGNYFEKYLLEDGEGLLQNNNKETSIDQLKWYVKSLELELKSVKEPNHNTTHNVSNDNFVHKKFINPNRKDAKLNSFWLVDNEYNEHTKLLDDIFAKKIKNHVTCLVTSTKCKYHYKALILITTHATNFERRETIRNTWGSDPLKSSPRWKTVFLIGRSQMQEYSKQMLYEIQKYDDIILGDVMENFYQLSYKVQMGFEWAVKYCSFDFLFKGDDDVFVNLPRLFSFIASDDIPKEGLYAGTVQYQAWVQRSGRYAVSKKEYIKSIYPRYCSGGGFILSKDVVKAYIPLFKSIPALRIDDAYIGILAMKAGVDVIHSGDFRMYEDENKCIFNDRYVAQHPVKSERCMKKLFTENLLVKKEMI